MESQADLRRTSLKQIAWVAAFTLVLTFVPAGTLLWLGGWLYFVAFVGGTLALMSYFLKHDPELVRRRSPMEEPDRKQKTIQKISVAFSCLVLLISGLDHRFKWSHMPTKLSVVGAILILVSYYFVFLVFKENSFAASTVRVESDQRVITTGPYALVRHPMYTASLLMFLAGPLALGSWWALIPEVVVCAMIVLRLLEEEKTLEHDLPGYGEYMKVTRYRLLPGVW